MMVVMRMRMRLSRKLVGVGWLIIWVEVVVRVFSVRVSLKGNMVLISWRIVVLPITVICIAVMLIYLMKLVCPGMQVI